MTIPATPGYTAPAIREAGPSPQPFPITPSDTVAINPPIRGFYVGATGNVACINAFGVAVTFVGVPAGKTIPAQVNYIKLTGTTAASIVGLV